MRKKRPISYYFIQLLHILAINVVFMLSIFAYNYSEGLPICTSQNIMGLYLFIDICLFAMILGDRYEPHPLDD